MPKKNQSKTTRTAQPVPGSGAETYQAPAPPPRGKIIGLDCRPDTFTVAVFSGQTPHEARQIDSRQNLGLEALLAWARRECGGEDLILMEAGANSFELARRLGDLGLRTCVLESAHVGKHAKTYADNDKMAAARIAQGPAQHRRGRHGPQNARASLAPAVRSRPPSRWRPAKAWPSNCKNCWSF